MPLIILYLLLTVHFVQELSTFLQLSYVLAWVVYAALSPRLYRWSLVSAICIFGATQMITIWNEGSTAVALKNILYLLTPLLGISFFRRFNLGGSQLGLILLQAVAITIFINFPTNYVVSVLGGTPRMTGFGINPNVFGLSCALLVGARKFLFSNQRLELIFLILSFVSVYLSGSRTALLLLPIAIFGIRLGALYAVIFSTTAFIYLNQSLTVIYNNVTRLVPSLYQRFDIWQREIDDGISFIVGKGYDYFGGLRNTVLSDEVRIVDNWYFSSVISGGAFVFLLILLVYFLWPLYLSIKLRSNECIRLIFIFAIANLTGNFLENGFPANVLYFTLLIGMLDRQSALLHKAVEEGFSSYPERI